MLERLRDKQPTVRAYAARVLTRLYQEPDEVQTPKTCFLGYMTVKRSLSSQDAMLPRTNLIDRGPSCGTRWRCPR